MVGSSLRFRIAVSLCASALMAGVLAAVPALAAEEKAPPKPAPVANKNHGQGGASALGAASVKARDSKKRVEVTGERTATETVFANPDGSFTRERTEVPVRAKGAEGKFVPIDPALTAVDGRLKPKVAADDVSFSGDGGGPLATLDLGESGSIALALDGVVGSPKVDGAIATYPVKSAGATADASVTSEPSASGAAADPTLVLGAASGGFSSRVILDQAPATAPVYRFIIDTSLNATLKDGVLSFVDAEREVVAQTRPLKMWDAQTDEGGDPSNVADVDADLTRTKSGWALTLKPSMKFLGAQDTKYPVVIDPDLTKPAAEDTYYYEGQSTASPQVSSYALFVGTLTGPTEIRSLLMFDYTELLGFDIDDADLTLKQYFSSAPSCAAKPTNLYPITSNVNINTVTWTTKPTVSTDPTWTESKSFNHGTTCAVGTESIDVTSMVDGWAGQQLGSGLTREGIEIRAGDENDTSQQKRFCSANWTATVSYCADASVVPTLTVTYRPQLGSQSWYSMTNHRLNDRSNISVNNQTGNLLVQAQDVKFNGVGLDLEVSRSYNSQTQGTTSLGKGWTFSMGPDVWLEKKSNERYDLHAPGGTIFGPLTRKSDNPSDPDYNKFNTSRGGLSADLEQSGTNFTLTYRKSQAKLVFSDNSPDDNAYMTQAKDRSGNHIDIAYSGTTTNQVPKMSTITDTNSRTFTVTYTGDVVTKISNTATGPGTREWKYGYTSGYLTTYTDPDNKVTTYSYSAAVVPPNLLTTIEDPISDTGSHPTTYVEYGAATPITSNEATAVKYKYDSSNTYNFTWDYNSDIVADCKTHGDFSTVVTDPNNHDTTYCFANHDTTSGGTKTWVYDALDNARSVGYNEDNQPTNITSPTGDGVSNGSTVATYATSKPDQLNNVTDPKGDAAQNATSGFQYDTTGAAGSDYLPSAVTTNNGDCNRFGYDSKGRATDAYTGIAMSTATTCGSSSSGTKIHRDYDDPTGNVTASWDSNAGSSPTSDDKTIYTYWGTSDSGYVSGTKDLVKSIRKPGGDCSTGTSRKLCTSYTYDGAGRILSETDGNGNVTTYAYDALDRTTFVYFDGTTSCSLTKINCIQYQYDAEGNLIHRIEALGSSTYEYDLLNRQDLATTPISQSVQNDVIYYLYDGVGNLTKFQQYINGSSGLDTVDYAYDAADRLDTVTDASGTVDIGTDKDGRTTSITYPHPTGTNGTRVEYAYSGSGKPKTMKVRKADGTGGSTFAYDYTKSIFGFQVDSPQMQGRDVSSTGLALDGSDDYAYSKGRLTSVDSTNTDYSYAYDDVGNVSWEQIGATKTYYGYNMAGQLCWQGTTNGTQLARACPSTPSGDTTVTSDKAGNSNGTSSDPITVNTRNQVTQTGGATHTMLDLGNDLRIQSGSTRQITSSLGITSTKTGSNISYYTRLPDGTVISSHNQAATVSNYAVEPNGNVALVANSSGTNVAAYTYSPYGKTTLIGALASANPFRYIGGYQDTTSTGGQGLYKLGARYYDTHGHFTQPDPQDPYTGYAYLYAGGDPVNSTDPSGRFSLPDPGDLVKAFKGASVINDIVSYFKTCGASPTSSDCEATTLGIYGGLFAGAACAAILTPTTGVGELGCGAAASAGYVAGYSFSKSRNP